MKWRALLLSFFAMIMFAAPAFGAGGSPFGPLGGSVYLSSRPFHETTAKLAINGGGPVNDLARQAETRFVESKDTHSWTIYFVSYVDIRDKDLEYQLRILDVSERVPKPVLVIPQRVEKAGRQIVVSSFTLDAKYAALVGKHLMVTVTAMGQPEDMRSQEFVLYPAPGQPAAEPIHGAVKEK